MERAFWAKSTAAQALFCVNYAVFFDDSAEPGELSSRCLNWPSSITLFTDGVGLLRPVAGKQQLGYPV